MSEERKKRLVLIQRALKERSYLLRISDVLGYAVGFREKGGDRTDEPVLVVYVKKGRKENESDDFPRHQRIPRRIKLTVEGGTTWVGVDLIESEVGQVLETTPSMDGSKTIISGLSVGNRFSATNTGTIGWIARLKTTGQPVICCNFHIFLRFSESAYEKNGIRLIYRHTDTNPEYITSPSRQDGGDINQDMIGNVLAGERTPELDIAIAGIENDKKVNSYLKLIGPLETVRSLKEDELDPSHPIGVSISGRSSGLKHGNILEYPAVYSFVFPDLPNGLMMTDLIVTSIPTQAGDSGALLVDEGRHPMGMLIGRAGRRSFFMHIRNIMNNMNLKEFI